MSGIYKTNNSVYRDKHENGHCAKLVTHIEKVKVLGLINIKVLAAGSLFLGDVREPITGTKDGPKAINWGIPFTHRPKAVRFDYKTPVAQLSHPHQAERLQQCIESGRTRLCCRHPLSAEASRDANGNITAKRVGTMVVKYSKSTNGWVNGATYTMCIHR